MDKEAIRATIHRAAFNDSLKELRYALADYTAEVFTSVGTELHVAGHLVGSDRQTGNSPFGHGSDQVVAISVLLRVGSQLVSASADLFKDGRHYAAAALLRQLVEVEYLAWTFETHDREGERWLRSSKEERMLFFTPAKLRKASRGKFRSKDYGYHCELGGHPVPGASALLDDGSLISQLLLADLLGHSGRIWDHIVGWSRENPAGAPVLRQSKEMSNRYQNWKAKDPLSRLPPPP